MAPDRPGAGLMNLDVVPAGRPWGGPLNPGWGTSFLNPSLQTLRSRRCIVQPTGADRWALTSSLANRRRCAERLLQAQCRVRHFFGPLLELALERAMDGLPRDEVPRVHRGGFSPDLHRIAGLPRLHDLMYIQTD